MARNFTLGAIEGDTVVSMTATGITAATAATVTADHVMVDVVTTTNRGVILRAMDAGQEAWISNGDSTEALYIYPPSGCKFNNQTADLHVLVPYGKACSFKFLNATHIIANVSA